MALFDWSQYLILAKDLSTRSDEAALRSSISRAYYAAYHHAKTYCASKSIPIINSGGGNSDHYDLWETFGKRAGTTFAAVHTMGNRLKRKRVNADYDANISGLAGIVADSIRDSDAIFYYLKI